MNIQAPLSQNQNQIRQLLNDNNPFIEPNIKKAKFILSTSRIYTLEFDQNIQMAELKMMIQKAAHLRKNSFSLLSEGENYTQYNEETFESLFPDKQLVVFTLELLDAEQAQDETEFLLQINMPCPDHNYKFLLYYCFDCGKSICSECFTHGIHKGHHIQDKCFYLLPSKYLVEKMFENWSQKPYEEFQISVDLNNYKAHLKQKIFAELLELLLQVQNKCNDLIDKYNQINEKSLNNIRDSVRDIKLFCIKALDEYKNAINIKDIINNEEMFIDFDTTYKELGAQQKEKFKENIQKFNELNKGTSLLVKNLVDNICQKLHDTLIQALNNKQYEEIENKINLKLIKPLDKEQMMNQISDKKNKIRNKKYERKTVSNYNKIAKNISENAFDIGNNMNNKYSETAKGRHTMITDIHPPLNPNNSLDQINNTESNIDMSNNSYDNVNVSNSLNYNEDNLASNGRNNGVRLFNDTNRNDMNPNNKTNINSYVNKNNNYSYDSNMFKPLENKIINNNTITNITKTQTLNNNNIFKTNTELYNNNSQNLEPSFVKNRFNIPKTTLNKGYGNLIFSGYINNTNNNNSNQNGINIKTKEEPINNIFSAVLNNKIKYDNTGNMFNNDNTGNIFEQVSNQKVNNIININEMNEISPILENRTNNQNNSNQSNNSSFNHDINNLNNVNLNKEKIEISNPFLIENVNSESSKNKKIFGDNNNYNNRIIQMSLKQNEKSDNLNLESPFGNVNKAMNNKNIFSSNTNSNINETKFNNHNINLTSASNPTGIYQNEIKTTHIHNINDPKNIFRVDTNIFNKNITQTTQILTQKDSYPKQNKNNLNFASVIAEKIKSTQLELDNNTYSTFMKNKFNPILEEAAESESELKNRTQIKKNLSIEYYLKKPFILCPIPGTNKLKIITDEESDENTIDITFPKEIGISYFLKDCAYCNYNKKLYISGGIIEGENETFIQSKKCFVIDLFQTNLEGNTLFISELHPMTYPKNKHSMIGYEDKIYVVGGEKSDVVECYDIKDNTWELINPMTRNRAYPNLYIYEGYLYAFFGKDEEDYIKSIERINLTNVQTQSWEMILFDNPNNVDVRIYGCGLHQVDECIYFFGGKCMGQDTDEIFSINMKERFIEKLAAKLKWKESFRENTLFQLGNKLVQISDEKYFGNYLKVVIE